MQIKPFLVIYKEAKRATFHNKLSAAKVAAKKSFGEVFERDPFSLPDKCELPIWAGVFKDNIFVPYLKRA